MIKKLTIEQEAKMPEYVKKWTDIGVSTNTDREQANILIDKVYKNGGLPPPIEKVWCQSPKGILEYIAKDRNITIKEARQKTDFCYGSHDVNWLAFYDYFSLECGLNIDELDPLKEISKIVGWFAPFSGIVVFSDKPIECHTILNNRGNNILHKDDSAALLYGDGYALWYLNGIEVPREIVETPADLLDAKLIQTEKNADVRREIIRKIGIKRVIEQLGAKTIEKATIGNCDYELVMLTVNDTKRPYLKMKDATTDETYIEGVPPNITTVKSALAWRENEEENTYAPPEVRT